MKVAIQGCCHGELDILYATLKNESIDLLIICGDFQCLRSPIDLPSLACPAKYRRLGNFYEYYCGLKEAPFPTLFIGGNHEASSYLWELFHGGFVAPNIYFLGFAGVVKFGGLRIAGVSGIYKDHHYDFGYYEKHPLSENDCRSIYHTRKYNIYRLSQIKEPIDIFLSHDWPRGIYNHGNIKELMKKKPFFIKEIERNTLGSEPNEMLLKLLRPRFWFSAHLHVKFEANYSHSLKIVNPDEILMDDESIESDGEEISQNTQFLALDKILPGREFFKILDIPTKGNEPLEFVYDEEWMSIVHAAVDYMSMERTQVDLPDSLFIEKKISESREFLRGKISKEDLKVSEFIMTAPPYDDTRDFKDEDFKTYINPQTAHFCKLLGIKNIINPTGEIVLYGDPTRVLKQKYAVDWNSIDNMPADICDEKSQNEEDGYI